MSLPKNICLITSVFMPYTRGGAESIVANIVNGFKQTSHQIFVITICPFKNLGSLWPKRSRENNLTIYRFYPLNLFSYLNINNYKKKPLLRLCWHGLDMFNLHSYFVVKHILKKEKPAVVMTHVLKGIGYLTCRATKKLGIKNIHTLHDVQLATPSGLILKGEENAWQHNFFLTRVYQKFNRLLFNSPEIVISSSKFLLEFYNERKFFPYSKKVILTNPIQTAPSTPSVNSELALSLPKGQASLGAGFRQVDRPKGRKNFFTFLFLGQIEKYKGVLLLINVFKKLLNEVTDKCVNLLIVGNGSALEEAKKMAIVETLHATSLQNQINFLGYVPNQELNKIFVQTNTLVVPSLCYENSPTVIFESLSYGVPVIAARIGGIEFIKDNYNGFTFKAGDKDDLLRVLKFSLENKNKLANMSANCRESVKEIGVGKYIKKLEELI